MNAILERQIRRPDHVVARERPVEMREKRAAARRLPFQGVAQGIRLDGEKDKALERRFQPVYVDEPGFEESVAILRGLKERYEVHHGVEITDPAIVAAATLSHRYISDRQLPDKAIDLIDEAASRIRIEIDSKPEAMDKLERRIIQLKIEREALKKESDEASSKRLEELEEKLNGLEKEYSDLEEIWKAEKAAMQGTTHIKEELERARLELETAHRANDLARMSELQYGRIPELEKQLEEAMHAETRETTLLRNNVTEEEVAEVVSKWTGIPVSQMMETEAFYDIMDSLPEASGIRAMHAADLAPMKEKLAELRVKYGDSEELDQKFIDLYNQ